MSSYTPEEAKSNAADRLDTDFLAALDHLRRRALARSDVCMNVWKYKQKWRSSGRPRSAAKMRV